MGLFNYQLTYKNQDLLELFNKIVDPTNQSIDWQSYFLFCDLDDYSDWKDGTEIILHIRNTINDYRNNRIDNKNKNNNNIGSEKDNERIKNDSIKKVEYKKKDK